MIKVFHVQGSAIHRGHPYSVNFYVEAVDVDAALRKTVKLMRRQGAHVMGLAAHRCGVKEREIEEWVRGLFETIRAEAKQERGTE